MERVPIWSAVQIVTLFGLSSFPCVAISIARMYPSNVRDDGAGAQKHCAVAFGFVRCGVDEHIAYFNAFANEVLDQHG